MLLFIYLKVQKFLPTYTNTYHKVRASAIRATEAEAAAVVAAIP